jgi:hypothetical protein
MCQFDPGFLCARFNPWVTQRNTQPARRENVFTLPTQLRTGLTACHALHSQRHSTTRKVTLRCGVLGTTYLIGAKYFVCTSCVKYTAGHRQQTTNHTSTFNFRIRLTLIDHNLTIITKIIVCYNELHLKTSLSLIIFNLILGHMQHTALLSIWYL